MYVHVVHDLGQEELVKPYEALKAACGAELRAAHEVSRPESEADICERCRSWLKRNRFQNYRCAVEMSARGGGETAGAGG